MIVEWSRRMPAAVRSLTVNAAGLVTADTGHGAVLLDRDGMPARAAALAGAAPTDPALAVSVRDDAVRLCYDGTLAGLVRLPGPVARVAHNPSSGFAAATASGMLYGLRTGFTARQAALLRAAEAAWLAGPRRGPHPAAALLPALHPEFTLRRLGTLAGRGRLAAAEATAGIRAAARDLDVSAPRDPHASHELAETLRHAGEPGAAAALYQRAAAAPGLRAASLTAAGECLELLGLTGPAQACLRRAAAEPTGDQLRAVYDMARRLDEEGSPEAGPYLELVVSWDAGYRDAWQRLAARAGVSRAAAPAGSTGEPGTERLLAAVREADRAGALSAGTGRTAVYNALWYERFDNSDGADSAKKMLEMAHFLASIDVARVRRALDVGSGTLRYPQVLAALGIHGAGIDLAVEGVRRRVPEPWLRRFAQADATALPFRDASLDLITCAMGTVDHFGPQDRARFLAEAHRTLASGGLLALGAWDPRCEFGSLLSLYTAAEAAALRRQLVPPQALARELAAAGLAEVRVVPFCLLPDCLLPAAAWPPGAGSLMALVRLDEAVRAADPDLAGQMFLASGRRP